MRKKLLFLACAVLTAAALTVSAPRAEASRTCVLSCVCYTVTCICSDGGPCNLHPPFPPIACIWTEECEGGLDE